MNEGSATKFLSEYERDVLIGGNHLANCLLLSGMDPASERHSTYGEVLTKYGQPSADIWAGWRAIMNWRDAQGLPRELA